MSHDFIDERSVRALPLDQLSPLDRGVVSQRLGLAGTDGNQLAQRLADPTFLRALLLPLPALCLVALETLIEGGGMLRDASLRALVAKRTGCSRPQVDAAMSRLFDSGLVLGLSRAPGAPVGQVGVLAPVVRPLYELLAGVSLPHDPPPNDPPAREARRRHRDLLALAASAAHRKPRLTRAGVPDRSSLKRLSKGLGVELEEVERALLLALRLGWMVRSYDGLAPSAPALVRAAQGDVSGSSDGALRCASLIEKDRWTSVEALTRALWRAEQHGSAFYMEVVPVPQVEAIAAQLAELPAVQLTQHAGAQWVRRVALAGAGGDGHVTPSFEVLLGPEAELATVVRVGLCCELLRVDHVLSLRLTPQSVAVGLACGLDPSELRSALAGVGPHGLPDNVAFMLDDWIKTSRLAQLRRGTFLFTDDATADRIAAGLGDDVLSRPAPGVIELDASIAGSALEKTLSKAGVALRASGSLDDLDGPSRLDRHAVARLARDARSERPLLPLSEPDPELRAAVLRARQSSDYGVKARAPGESDDGGDQALREIEDMARTQDAPAELFELLALLRKWQKAMPGELSACIKRVPKSKQEQAQSALELPMNILPWLLLNEKWRSRSLKMASDVEGLNRQAQAVSQGGRLRPEGDRAIALLQKPQVVGAIERAISTLAGGGADDDTGEFCEQCGRHHRADEMLDGEFDELDDDDELAVHAAALGRQPLPGTMSPISSEAARTLISNAAKAERPVHIEVSDRGHRRVYSVLPEALRRRGREEVLLATDLKSLYSRVFRLEDIAAARIDAE